MLVKRVNPDGTLHLTHLGTMYPANFGLGPVTVLGNHQTLCGVLALGSEHTTRESTRIWETRPDRGADASRAKAVGVSRPAGLLCVPTLGTHGYEVIARQAIPTLTAVLEEFLRLPGPV